MGGALSQRKVAGVVQGRLQFVEGSEVDGAHPYDVLPIKGLRGELRVPGEHSACVQVKLDVPQVHGVQFVLAVGLRVWQEGSERPGLVVAGLVVRVPP
jgi:hypothetical protein